MNICPQFSELISAYADGELTQSERRRVEEHLVACESCSALLELYREISIAVEESGEAAPQALRDGVMEKVLGDGTAFASASIKKRKPIQVTLSKYAPIAACLAIMLLVMPWIINMLSHRSNGSALPGAESQLKLYTEAGQADENNMARQDFMPDAGGGSANVFGDAPTPAPEASYSSVIPNEPESGRPDVPPAATIPPGYATPSNDGIPADDTGAVTADSPDTQDPADPDMRLYDNGYDDFVNYPFDALGPTMAEPEETPAGVPPGAPMAATAPDEDSPEQEADSSVFTGIQEEYPTSAALQAPGGASDIFSGFRDAYAWITIYGKLPDILREYEQEPLDDQDAWDALLKIPRSKAKELIAEITGREGVEITMNDNNGEYAVVLYSSRG